MLEGRRDKVILASKSGKRDGEGIRRELEASLAALRTDHIEFYFFHGVNTMEDLDTITGPGGALDALLKAKDEGLITGLGFSSHRPPEMYLEALKRLPLSVILIWDNYLEEQYVPEIQQEVYPLAREKGVGITAMKPLADGFLYQSPELALRYALGSGSEVLICGMNAVEHVEQAVAALAKGPLDAEETRCGPARRAGVGTLRLPPMRRVLRRSDAPLPSGRLRGPADDRLPAARSRELRAAPAALRAGSIWRASRASALPRRDGMPTRCWPKRKAVACPYDIDVARKARLTLGKLRRGEDKSAIMSLVSHRHLARIVHRVVEAYRMNKRKLLRKILNAPQNVKFNEMLTLVTAFGFELARVSGSHHIFTHPDVPELVNLQNVGGQAKPYQIRQFLKLVERYNVPLGGD